jgi:glycogen debranching enzyme
VQAQFGPVYQGALKNLIDLNTMAADPSVYDASGLLSYPPGTFVQAGGGYPSPQRWTRDCAVNAWNAASLLGPAVARNTLWAVVNRQPDGSLIVQQDNQWWDQIIWVLAAWNHYLITGDHEFLTHAYQASQATLAARLAANFNAGYGLFEGPGYMDDGIAGYPSPPWEPSVGSSFVLDYPHASQLMCLSSNCLYYGAYQALAGMAGVLGDAGNRGRYRSAGARLRQVINEHLWRGDAGLYGYLIHGPDQLAGQLDTHQEGGGLAFAVMLGVADPARARMVLDAAHWQPYGIVNSWPHFARFDDQHPGRHNVIVWPNVHAFFGHAAAIGGRIDLFARAAGDLNQLVTASGGDFYELYNSVTGTVDGGWQTSGPGQITHWASQPDQTWSATGYLRLIYAGLFGMNFAVDGLRLAPTLPPRWGPVSLHGLAYRAMTLDISLRGDGNRVKSFTLDGQAGPPVIPAGLTGHHVVAVELD